METVKILNPGPFTTVQDLGRWGYQRYGMAPAGAMDDVSFRLGNYLLGNEFGQAGLEFTLQGPSFEILCDTFITVTGGWCDVFVNGKKQPIYAPLELTDGDQVSFSRITKGLRGYVLFQGGIDVPLIMNSRSTYLRGGVGGISGRELKPGDKLFTTPNKEQIRAPLPTDHWPVFPQNIAVDVIMGPQEYFFTDKGIEIFLEKEFTISEAADRMGYRLSGPEILHKGEADIISDGIPLGAIQVPGHQQPIIMMKDRQTTGGYPKIATVASYDIYKLAQAKPGDKVIFNKATLREASQKRVSVENWFQYLLTIMDRPVKSKKMLRMLVDKGIDKQITLWELD